MFSNTHTDQHFRIKYRHCLCFHANVYALDVSRIDYCNAILAAVHDLYLLQLQRVLNAVARLIAREQKYDSISATLQDALHWLPIRQRVEFKLSVVVFNTLHNLAPGYLSTVCQPVADNAGRRHLRSAVRGDLAVPATRTLRYGPPSFAVAGPSTWNSLPAPLRSCHLTCALHRDLKPNCLSERITNTLVTVSSCKSG